MYQLPPHPSLADVQKLQHQQVPESLVLDYKRDPYGSTDEDKRELLRDVASFANGNGGHIVLGVEAAASIPTGLPGIQNADAEVGRLVSLIRSSIDPRLSGLAVSGAIRPQ